MELFYFIFPVMVVGKMEWAFHFLKCRPNSEGKNMLGNMPSNYTTKETFRAGFILYRAQSSFFDL
jgi:hypothetical protein